MLVNSQVLAANAQIIFCPYNYLLDPSISSAMNLNLENAVVILDEGHNIEGVCRGATLISVHLCC